MATNTTKDFPASYIGRSNRMMNEYRASVIPDSFISPLSQGGPVPPSDSRHRQQPPPPPPLTKKLLELMESGLQVEMDRKERSPLPSTDDSPTQAMKRDLEELIQFVDRLAFESTRSAIAAPPPHMDANSTNARGIFRDRTNQHPVTTSSTPMKKLFAGPGGGNGFGASNVRGPRTAVLEANHDTNEDTGKRLEPAGSPPEREASLYFHDESLSLILSQSEDDDEMDGTNHGQKIYEDGSSAPLPRSRVTRVGTAHHTAAISTATATPRLLATLQGTGSMFGGGRTVPLPASHDRISGIGYDESNKKTDPNGSKSAGATKTISFLPVTKDPTPQKVVNGASIENKAAMVTPLPTSTNASPWTSSINEHTTLAFNGNWDDSIPRTPFPHQHRHDNSSNDEVPETVEDEGKAETDLAPQTWHDGDSLLRHPQFLVNSPESAKKLLQTAVEALKDARQEREAARQWANEMKDAVHQWVEEQRQLIRTESSGAGASTTDASTQAMTVIQQQLEQSIHSLHQEISQSNSSRQMLQGLLLKQDEQIRTMSVQLTAMKQQLESIVERTTTSNINDRRPDAAAPEGKRHVSTPANGNSTAGLRSRSRTVPIFVNETPPVTSSQRQPRSISSHWSLASTCSHQTGNSSRIRRKSPNGGHLIEYGNGVIKEVHPDGTTVTRFPNGDVETKFCDNSLGDNKDDTYDSRNSNNHKFGIIAYFHCKEGVLQITQKDGSILYEYSDGQVERHYGDGTKVILFPDGTKNIVVQGKSSRVE